MKTFAVIGSGRFGTAIAEQLFNMGYEVLVVERDEAKVQAISEYVTQAVVGDGKDKGVLRALGIRNYDCVIVAIGEDLTDSVLTTLLLKELGVPRIICKAQDNNHKKILLKIGADRVVIPEHEMGVKLASNLVRSNVLDFIELSEHYGIIEITVPEKWINRTIFELELRKKYGINVIAVKKDAEPEEVQISPNADYSFEQDDSVVIIGRQDAINTVSNL
jgi:trk system potassium uptake protein TrkA